MQSDPEHLSSFELRSRLFESLRKTGVADKLKSQLRSRIVSELKLRIPSTARAQHCCDPGSPKSTILNRAIDSLILEYLRYRDFDYTLSVFLPECGLDQAGQAFSKDDIIRVLNIDHPTALFRNLRPLIETEDAGLLPRLLHGLSRAGDIVFVEKEMQTDFEFQDILGESLRRKGTGPR
ncbi:uncharacterized protein BJ171DRAFT_15186 [Polychytrium aggregatum]|uniref:uncharacterized protein n=1 Tax=Polychytrium aggregatum TaxID=110093 RepID=UPI0022FEBFF4|nr:uncharacterized protein BJ171DRAFT_15186 [Polychytrium aggregatum]KAI9206595.1 hypothetical protein BJ171DRAFT_15186 [Polychytrium aggregatum]